MEAASDGFSATMSTVTGAMLTAWASPNSYTTCILFGKGVQENFTAQI